jgi:hypothetical protein
MPALRRSRRHWLQPFPRASWDDDVTRRSPHKRGDRVADKFAEELAIDGSIPAAAKRLGVSYNYGNVLFQQIRRELGDQAR